MIAIALIVGVALQALLMYAVHQLIKAKTRATASGCAVIVNHYQERLRSREAKGFTVDRAWQDLAEHMLEPEWIEEEADRICRENRAS